MTHSPLATISVPAHTNNYTKGRKKSIRCVTIHHVAGVATAQAIGNIFANPNRKGSSNYGIGNDGTIGVFVEEENTPWTNSNFDSNSESITIETSNSATGGEWPVSDAAYSSLIRLVADIAKRNGLGRLIAGQNLTWHSMFAKTACPGDYLRARIGDIANKANDINYPPTPTLTWVDDSHPCMINDNDCQLVKVLDGSVVKSYSAGTTFNIAQSCEYNGNKYYRTEYSKKNNVDNGFIASALHDYIEPAPEPEPEPQPEPAPEPEKPAEEPTVPKETNVFLAIIKAIIEFIKQVLTRRK